MVELIICEKPKAAAKMAEALADDKIKKESVESVPYYKITHNGKEIIVGAAVGHLYTLSEKDKGKWEYPIFNVEWKPTSEVSKSSSYVTKYLDALKKLSKKAEEFTIATDYDVEGEVIGLNVVRFIAKQNDANRMKFSTLTNDELVEAYESKSKHLDWGQAHAGETRHIMDWYYGINISRALTLAMKTTGGFKILSSGRVQGPALKIIVDREKEIQAFKPELYWQLFLDTEKNLHAIHKREKFWKKEEVEKIYKKIYKEKTAIVVEIKKRETTQMPPHPFDLTTLQTEAYRCFGINPKKTLEIAQELYVSGYISYPRTSSQQLSEKIDYKKILAQLQKQQDYGIYCADLLKKSPLMPNNGKKTDPAHPAIYPTGIAPRKLKPEEHKLYDLVVRRFLATFGDSATRETVEIDLDCAGEIFILSGGRTKVKGWHVLYSPYVDLKEEELPYLNEKQQLKVEKIFIEEKETKPPKRYTEASIIRELEKRNLGTKATRAQILDTLFQRHYIVGKQIQATELGIKTIETLEKYCPEIIDEQLTSHFEEEMEKVRTNDIKEEDVLEEAKKTLEKVLEKFKKSEKKIGEELSGAVQQTRDEMSHVGKCQVCKEGILRLRKGKFGLFIAAYDANPFLSPGLSQLLIRNIGFNPYIRHVNVQGIASTAFPKTLEIAENYLVAHPKDYALICVSGVSSYWFQNQVRGLKDVMEISQIRQIKDKAKQQMELQKWIATMEYFLFGDGVASVLVANEGNGIHVEKLVEVTNISRRDYLAGYARLSLLNEPFKFGFHSHLDKEIPKLGIQYTAEVIKKLFGDDAE
ncbi:MAG: DNA topoisomerase I, partial [Candidatus Woesearchaeota archaeon]